MPSICGYQIGLDRTHVNEDTRILYVTTGVLLQKLIAENADEAFLKQYTHIILDEVHEREIDTDFVLLVTKIKSFQNLTAKVVLMSATIETNKFREYFGTTSTPRSDLRFRMHKSALFPAPKISINSRCFQVEEFYWDDLTSAKSHLSSMLASVYKERVEKYRRASDINRRLKADRNGGYDYRSFRFDQRILDSDQQLTKHGGIIDEISVQRELRLKMQNLNFDVDEPSMLDEAMLMVITLLR
jgi:HrpA-like RNA helicase